MSQAPIQAEGRSAVAAAGDVVDDVIDCEEDVEVQVPRGMPQPSQPSPQEVARHNLTHWPYRSWCPHCVSCRRPNSHHRKSRPSSSRNIPLFCADYCFVKDSADEQMDTILAGRLYPSKAVLATVCSNKGNDELAIARLTSFIKEAGIPKLVYKSDQEHAITFMIEEALRRSGRSGIPEEPDTFNSGLQQAVAEFSAVGESASNGKAERTVQAVEDMVRTLKSALESRIKSRIGTGTAIMKWLVEHVATILNRYSVNQDGQTPYFASHGKRPSDRLVEFGEKVFFFVPKKARAKLDHRWRLGTFIGISSSSNENFVALPNGNVVRSRSVARVVEEHRWDAEAILAVRGVPGRCTPNGPESIGPDIEESMHPHLEGDAEIRDVAEDDDALVRKDRKQVIDPQIRITARDHRLYGYTSGCTRCDDLKRNADKPHRHHNNECRLRMYLAWKEHGDVKWNAVKHIVEPDVEERPSDKATVDFKNFGAIAPETPIEDYGLDDIGEWNPAAAEQPDMPPRVSANDPEDPDVQAFYPSDMEDDDQLLMDGSKPMDLGDDRNDDDDSPDAMIDALVGAGTCPKAAQLFTYAVMRKDLPSSFMEIYGRGSIMKEANGPRRALNIEGLAALDIRTFKPDGSPWDFNRRSDRNLARSLIDERQPTWIIGSPPCTSFSIWNQNLNFKNMPKEKVRELIAEGRKHLSFVTSLYRKQLQLGRHFLHEHPVSATSWKEPQIMALTKDPRVHCVVADQCQYALTTPAEGSPDVQLPALKPTRFMTSSPQMAAELNKRCPRIHQHQHCTWLEVVVLKLRSIQLD